MKPILFNTDMVCAILAGRKTVTRRVVKPQHLRVLDSPYSREHPETPNKVLLEKLCDPPYRPGDILYVREAWTHTCMHCKYYPDMFFCHFDCGTCPEFVYKADGVSLDGWPDERWRPSIHMPREAARIFLRVTGVRVERLQDISMKDVRNEGIEYDIERPVASYGKFVELWDSTIRPGIRALYGWGGNPWVWVIEFERYEKSEAAP